MMGGFDYFDGNHRENFCAALMLLALEEDLSFRPRLAALVCKRIGLPESRPVNDWEREAGLDIEQGKPRQSDLWLRFGAERFLIEMKTRSN